MVELDCFILYDFAIILNLIHINVMHFLSCDDQSFVFFSVLFIYLNYILNRMLLFFTI